MTTLQFKNNASTTLSGSINNTQTSITVVSAANFPVLAATDYFYVTMYEVTGNPATEINIEIVKVTATSGANWTIARGQDGTTARSRNGVDTCYIELRLTAASAQEMLQKSNNLSDLANAATARTNLGLGSIATQSASSVAITGGTIAGVTLTSLDASTTIQDNTDPTKQVRFEVSGVTTATTRTLTVPNSDGTLALTSDLTAGYQPLDSDLTAVAGLSANGLIARTGAGTAAVRAITQPAAGITVTNGDGVSGNPTLALANDLAGVEALNTTGFVRRTAADTWSASALVDADIPGALTGKTYNALTLSPLATGFSVAGGTTSKTLTVNKSLTLDGTDGTTITFPTISGTLPLNNQTFFIGTTSVAINRASAALSLTGVNIDGSAGSATSATTATNVAGGAANRIPVQSGAGATAFIVAPTVATTYLRWTGSAFDWASVSGGGGGTVTSVGITSSDLTVSNSPITTNGDIGLSLNTVGIAKGGTGQTTATAAFDALSPATTLGDLIYHDGTDNVRLAGNTVAGRRFLRQTGTGAVSAAPAWDSLTDGDIPSALTGKTYNALTLTAAATGFTIAGGTTSKTLTVSNTLTLAGTDSSTLNIGAGGTLGTAAFTASTAYAPAAGSSSITTVGTIGSGTWQGSAIGISYGGTGATSKTAAYDALSPMTTLGDLTYHDGTDAVRLAGSTSSSKRFLTQTGTGTVSAAPGWNAIVDADLPSALTGKTYNGLTLTANATGFQIAGGTTAKTLAISNNLTLAGTDGSTLDIGGGGTLGTGAYATIANYLPLTGGTLTGKLTLPNVSTSAAPLNIGNPGTTDVPSAPVNGDVWINNNGLQFRQGTTTQTVAILGGTQTFTGATTFSGTLTAQSNVNLGSNSGAATHNLGHGATTTGNTKTVNVGTSGASGSTTVVNIGSSTTGATSGVNLYGSTSLVGNLNFTGGARRVFADFSNFDFAQRLLFQTSTENSFTYVGAAPNGTSRNAGFIGHNASGAVDCAIGGFVITNADLLLFCNGVGSGAPLPIKVQTNGSNRATFNTNGGFDLETGLREARVAMGANEIDVRAGNYFTKTISGATTFTVANVPSAGTTANFILDLTNGGSATINWWTGVKWAGGTAPTLTAAGRDVLGFFTHDGGTTWTGLLLGKDVK